ncbi:hypothetical protein ACX3O0_01230 [Homoserinimonas sp. A447]
MDTPTPQDFLDELTAHLGTESLFATLADIDAVASAGTGSIIFNRRRDADGRLSEGLQAVALANTLGIESLDVARKRFPPPSEQRDNPARIAYVRAYERAMAHINTCRTSLETNGAAPLTLGMYAGAVAMERLVHTLFSAHLLYQLRLRIEADAVARIALEQIAWSVAVASFDSHNEIDAHEPQKSISALKRLVHQPDPGRLYGDLSSAAHAGIAQHHSVFDVSRDGRGVIKHGVTDWVGSARIVMSLADLWVIAYEAVQRAHLRSIVATLDESPFRADPSRPFLSEMTEALKEIERLESNGVT